MIQEGDPAPNGRGIQVSSIVVLENALKEFFITMNAWETMSMDNFGANNMVKALVVVFV